MIAARSGHALGKKPSLEQYAAAQHVLVSPTGAARGFMDDRKYQYLCPSFLAR